MDKFAATLFTIMANTMNENDLVEALENAIQAYRTNNDFDHIESVCGLIIHSRIMNRRGEGVEATLKRFEAFQKIKNAFDHTENNS